MKLRKFNRNKRDAVWHPLVCLKSEEVKSKAPKTYAFGALAGVEGLEPSQTVLETGVLPLTPYPYLD